VCSVKQDLGGHYVAYVKHPISQLWFEYDDSYVTKCSQEDILNKECYVVFYRRKVDWKDDEREFIRNLMFFGVRLGALFVPWVYKPLLARPPLKMLYTSKVVSEVERFV
jgi:hypothetical protein